ncbi:DUF4041 domain-containing protein [Photobacterium sanctipauli]|uniref:DUF4041 domain-containing protein n=2 Tax=Photobacterium sanctipauli TaxID=1342794 RepID=A0A2T3NP83_9GAMM|nr:DUF4041 domain-containing protein [Photobacterium sanctipauli]PSW18084.1 DUF4041 domain-containing protein [Photobacterium sanctipauli]
MDTNLLLILTVCFLVAVILTYTLTMRVMNKKINKYNTIEEALKNSGKENKKIEYKIKESLAELDEVTKNINNKNSEYATIKRLSEDANSYLSKLDKDTKALQELKSNENKLIENINNYEGEILALKSKIIETNSTLDENKAKLKDIIGQLDLYSRLDEYTSCGHFEVPQYLYETSARFAEEIKDVRQQQKDMIREKVAVIYPETTIISNNKSYNKKILDAQVKLMLTAFNTECDFLIGKISPSSFGRTLERIEKLANNIEKLSATFECGFNIDYIDLKFEECKLQFQYTLKKQEEAAEQKLIKEQIREEQRAIKEYEKAIAEAEKEEKLYRQMLDKAREELSMATDADRLAMEQKIASLELQLKDAEAKEERAKSMAEQTRKGHVYVISNIGSFGEDVYKIGLTRRLEPMDRVKELGDASVPFPFDVHAMIYVDDAPSLEAALHREFHAQRVNSVNLRKEFFEVDLESIREAVEKIAGVDAEFKMTALAEDYYESLRLQEVA